MDGVFPRRSDALASSKKNLCRLAWALVIGYHDSFNHLCFQNVFCYEALLPQNDQSGFCRLRSLPGSVWESSRIDQI